MTEAERESLGVHTPVWDHDECGFRLDCGCGEFTHFGLTRAEAESRWADHIAPVVERILASRDARLAALEGPLPHGETPDDLRWYATHEALSRHKIFDVLMWLADARAALHPDPSEGSTDA